MAKTQLKHLAQVVEGKFKFERPKEFLMEVKKLEGERVELVFKKFKPYRKRSIEQNNYYWGGVVQTLSDELGYTPEEMHEVLKFHHLGTKKEVKRGDKTIQLYMSGSTASLSTSEFEELMSKIRSWASRDLGIYIETPDEYWMRA